MKKSIIKELLYDSWRMSEIGITEEGKKYLSTICDTGEELQKQLTPEQWKLHEKLVDALERNWLEETETHMVEAFKMALRLGIECADD